MEAGASSPRGRASRGRRRRELALAAAGATFASASHARASVAPPPKITLPTVDRVTWTDAVLVAPTKAGKLRRKKGGGGGGDDAENVDPDGFGPGDVEADSGGSDGEGGDFGGDEGSGGSGGSGDSGDSGDEWLESFGGPPEDGNLLWAWRTLCGVAFASSVQHFVDTSVSAATGARRRRRGSRRRRRRRRRRSRRRRRGRRGRHRRAREALFRKLGCRASRATAKTVHLRAR